MSGKPFRLPGIKELQEMTNSQATAIIARYRASLRLKPVRITVYQAVLRPNDANDRRIPIAQGFGRTKKLAMENLRKIIIERWDNGLCSDLDEILAHSPDWCNVSGDGKKFWEDFHDGASKILECDLDIIVNKVRV